MHPCMAFISCPCLLKFFLHFHLSLLSIDFRIGGFIVELVLDLRYYDQCPCWQLYDGLRGDRKVFNLLLPVYRSWNSGEGWQFLSARGANGMYVVYTTLIVCNDLVWYGLPV